MTVPLIAAAEIALGRQRSPEQETGDHPVPYLRSANVADGTLLLDDVKVMNFTPREQSTFSLRVGDVLVTEGSGSRDMVGASAVWVGELPHPVCFQNTLLRLRPRPSISDGRYLAWWARHAHATGMMADAASGANILHLGAENLRRLAFPIHSIHRQRRIADFLDDQVARIDKVIAARRLQIELLDEARVTVPLEIVGEVARTTKSTRLGRFLSVRSGDFLASESFVAEGAYDVIGGNGVAGRYSSFNASSPVLAVGRVGALCGNVHLLSANCWVTDNALIVTPVGCDQGYLAMVLVAAQLNFMASRSAQPLITGEVIKSVRMPIPEAADQREAYRKWVETETDLLTHHLELVRSISLFGELKRSLITAAVSGEFDVSSADGSRVPA